MNNYGFEKLIVWQKAKDFTKDIYLITKKFPKSEVYGLTSQMRRASVSICSNIAEGSGKYTAPEKHRFYNFSYCSLLEVINQMILSNELGYIDDDTMNNILRPKAEELSKLIHALAKSVYK